MILSDLEGHLLCEAFLTLMPRDVQHVLPTCTLCLQANLEAWVACSYNCHVEIEATEGHKQSFTLYNKLSSRRETARRTMSVDILSATLQLTKNYSIKSCSRLITSKVTQGHRNRAIQWAIHHFLLVVCR